MANNNRIWIVQASKDEYDLDEALDWHIDNLDNEVHWFSTNRYRRINPKEKYKIEKGDKIYFWYTGGDKGIRAIGTVKSGPLGLNSEEIEKQLKREVNTKFIIGKNGKVVFEEDLKEKESYFFKLEKVFEDPITEIDINAHRLTKSMLILSKNRQATFFEVDNSEEKGLNIIIQNKSFVYMDDKNLHRNKLVVQQFKQVIFHGPPGTSKTWEAKKLAAFMLGIDISIDNWEEELNKEQFNSQGNNPKGAWDIVQFHPSYNYEDFVRGIQVKTFKGKVTYETVNKIILKMAEAAASAKPLKQASGNNSNQSATDTIVNDDEPTQQSPPPFILIIDEINRANLAAVLGELIYALEYREQNISSPYSIGTKGRLIMVPDNLYIIGTMNTADRSIGHIDYAVRRRFAFLSFLPDEERLNSYYYKDEVLKDKAIQLYKAVKSLFEKHLVPEFHADDVQVGHTYFMAKNEDELINKFIYQVCPILREYSKDGIFAENILEMELNCLNVSINEDPGLMKDKLEDFIKNK